jgi:hypothetical protein
LNFTLLNDEERVRLRQSSQRKLIENIDLGNVAAIDKKFVFLLVPLATKNHLSRVRPGLETIIFIVEDNFDVCSGNFSTMKVLIVEHVSLLRVGSFKKLLVEEEVDGSKDIRLSSTISAYNTIQSFREIAEANFVPVTAEAFELDLLNAHFQNVTHQDARSYDECV